MRATSRTPIFALVAASLVGIGCEAPLTLPDRFAVVSGPTVAAPPAPRSPRDVVTIGAPRPLALPVAGPAPARDEAAPIVWRASSQPVTPDDTPGPPVPVVRHVGVLPHRDRPSLPPQNELPKELNKVTLPPYRIEPPDVLLINTSRVIPRPPYKIEPLDELRIQAPPAQVMPNEPIGGLYPVGPDGQVDLGYDYGKVMVAGQTPEQARATIARHVADVHLIKPPAVVVTPVRTRGREQIRGEHPVRMDGTVSLGIYGDVYLAGLTMSEAKQAVEAQLAQTLLNPEVTVDVLASNSKVYYVIYDGGGYGQQVYKLPVVGGETVLDAIGALHGLPSFSSTHRIWVARPVPGTAGCRQIMPVDWEAITEDGATCTNYQLMPGDRIYVKADHWVALEHKVSKVLAPFQRIFAIPLTGNFTIRTAGETNTCHERNAVP